MDSPELLRENKAPLPSLHFEEIANTHGYPCVTFAVEILEVETLNETHAFVPNGSPNSTGSRVTILEPLQSTLVFMFFPGSLA